MRKGGSVRLTASFYRRDDVLQISRELLGKVICTRSPDGFTSAVITETEAYAGVDDRACHAYGGRRTKRTEPMFHAGGVAYVYLCYGIHHLFNVVTAGEGTPHAVLIRGGLPREGECLMLARRGKNKRDKTLLAGPGSLAKALGISTVMTGRSLLSKDLWLEDQGIAVVAASVTSGPRVGVDYAGKDALLPYRFIAQLPKIVETYRSNSSA